MYTNLFKINTVTFEMSRCSLKQIKLRSKFVRKSTFVHRTHGWIVLECLMVKARLTVTLPLIDQVMWQTSSRIPASGWSPPQSAGKGRKLFFSKETSDGLCLNSMTFPSFRPALLLISLINLRKPIYYRKLFGRESPFIIKKNWIFLGSKYQVSILCMDKDCQYLAAFWWKN